MPFEFAPFREIPDVVLVKPTVYRDERGWFAEAYKQSAFAPAGLPTVFPQDNHSRSVKRHIIRGLHYQLRPAAMGKLVRCTRGSVWDVAVDIRRGSPTYGRSVSVELSEDEGLMIWVPPGFAHGFCTLTELSEVVYKCSAEFSAPHDRAIRWSDPDLAIPWPTRTPVLSEKDARAPVLADADNDFVWTRPTSS